MRRAQAERIVGTCRCAGVEWVAIGDTAVGEREPVRPVSFPVATQPVEVLVEAGRDERVRAVWDAIDASMDQGIPSEDVGPMVVDAIRNDRFWLLPNGEIFFDVFQGELDQIKRGD